MAKKQPTPPFYVCEVEVSQKIFDYYVNHLITELIEGEYDANEATDKQLDGALKRLGLDVKTIREDERLVEKFKAHCDFMLQQFYYEDYMIDMAIEDAPVVYKAELQSAKKAEEKAEAEERKRLEKDGVAVKVAGTDVERARKLLTIAGIKLV